MSYKSELIWHRADEDLPSESMEVITISSHGFLETMPYIYDAEEKAFGMPMYAGTKAMLPVGSIAWWIDADEFFGKLPAPEDESNV